MRDRCTARDVDVGDARRVEREVGAGERDPGDEDEDEDPGDDRVAAGDDIVELEAEKSVIALQAPVGGVLSEIVAVVGDEINAGALVGVIKADS